MATRQSKTTGSSPLARGLLTGIHLNGELRRIIPARAGFTRVLVRMSRPNSDHPRSRGVYRCAIPCTRRWVGSSPLARGLPTNTDVTQRYPGIIPARAGFTPRGPRGPSLPGDHPRSRGVYNPCRHEFTMEDGSSPLARGLLISAWRPCVRSRIIPARAGFTDESRWRHSRVRDHPRSRGVYHRISQDDITHVRIIPARAGFTRSMTCSPLCAWDHPRSRGVYSAIFALIPAIAGSSPLARGLLGQSGGEAFNYGIIPARAGFTRPFSH